MLKKPHLHLSFKKQDMKKTLQPREGNEVCNYHLVLSYGNNVCDEDQQQGPSGM